MKTSLTFLFCSLISTRQQSSDVHTGASLFFGPGPPPPPPHRYHRTRPNARIAFYQAVGRSRVSLRGAAGDTGAFHTSNLTCSGGGTGDPRKSGVCRWADDGATERFRRNLARRITVDQGQSRRREGVRWEDADGVGKGGSAGQAGPNAREADGGGGGGRFTGGTVCSGGGSGGGASARCNDGWGKNRSIRGDQGTVEMVDTGAYCCNRELRLKSGGRGTAGSNGRATAARVTLLDPESVRRMEGIRRGIGGDAVLDVGVKANRRRPLQGGRCDI